MCSAKGWTLRDLESTLQVAKYVIVTRWPINADIAHSEPGGYLQWVEYDPMSFKVVSPDPSAEQNANEQHVHIIKGPNGQATELVSPLVSQICHRIKSLTPIF